MMRNVEIIVLMQALVAAEQRSFRKAGELLGVRASTISRRIRGLEYQLGVTVFQRHRHGICPTDAGALFLDEARRIVGDLQNLVTNMRATGRGETGRLRIGFYLSLSFGELRSSLLEFRKRFPDIDVRVTDTPRHCLVRQFNAGLLDVLVIAANDLPVGVEVLPLWHERILVALPKGHRLARRSGLHLDDLRDQCFLLPKYDPGPELRDFLLERFNGARTGPQLMLLDATRENALNLVSFGSGVTLLYEAHTGMMHDGVIYRELNSGMTVERTQYVACWNKANVSPALASFLDLLRERYPHDVDMQKKLAVHRATGRETDSRARPRLRVRPGLQ